MTNTKKACAYDKIAAGCPEEALSYSKDGLCIFHEAQKSEEDCERFWQLIQAQLEERDFMFSGYVFPNDVDFSKKTLVNPDFRFAIFHGDADFTGSIFQKDANFRRSIFRGDAYFGGSTFQGYAGFQESTFQGYAGFRESRFKGDAGFRESTFEGEADFGGSTFQGEARALEAKFKKPDYGELLYRAAKTACHNRGNYVEEGYYHQREMDAIRKQQPRCRRGWNFVIQRMLHGYGESPKHVFTAAVLVILVFSLLFTILGIQEQNPPREVHCFWTCLYYSVVTFTTLGYGDFHPYGITRIFAGLEAFMGAFLMALFVVTFARRWRRH